MKSGESTRRSFALAAAIAAVLGYAQQSAAAEESAPSKDTQVIDIVIVLALNAQRGRTRHVEERYYDGGPPPAV